MNSISQDHILEEVFLNVSDIQNEDGLLHSSKSTPLAVDSENTLWGGCVNCGELCEVQNYFTYFTPVHTVCIGGWF